MERGQKHAGARDDPPVQRELADRDMLGNHFAIDDPHRRQQRERDRQIVMRPFLGQVGGREIDRDPLGRQRQAHRGQRGMDPLAAFPTALSGRPTTRKLGSPAESWHCTSTERASSPR
jgi:hypothetical protein